MYIIYIVEILSRLAIKFSTYSPFLGILFYPVRYFQFALTERFCKFLLSGQPNAFYMASIDISEDVLADPIRTCLITFDDDLVWMACFTIKIWLFKIKLVGFVVKSVIGEIIQFDGN